MSQSLAAPTASLDEEARRGVEALLQMLPPGSTTADDVEAAVSAARRHAELAWASFYCTVVPEGIARDKAVRNMEQWLIGEFKSYIAHASKQQPGGREEVQEAVLWAAMCRCPGPKPLDVHARHRRACGRDSRVAVGRLTYSTLGLSLIHI